MRPNPQEIVDLVTFAKEIVNGKLHFFCAVLVNCFLHLWGIGIKSVAQYPLNLF